MQILIKSEKNIPVYLSSEEALLFNEFQRNYEVIAYLLGYMSSLKIADLTNASIQMDIDSKGKISHTAITKHYRS